MLPCYKGHWSNSEGIERDLKQQKQNHTPGNKLKGFEKKEVEPQKYNPSKEWDEYGIRQNTLAMKNTNNKIESILTSVKLKL